MISKFSVKKPYTVIVAVVLVIILGIVSFTKMTTDLLPSMELPYAIVMTTYQGVSGSISGDCGNDSYKTSGTINGNDFKYQRS